MARAINDKEAHVWYDLARQVWAHPSRTLQARPDMHHPHATDELVRPLCPCVWCKVKRQWREGEEVRR